MKLTTLAILAFASAGAVTMIVSGAGSGVVSAIGSTIGLQSSAGPGCHPNYRGICLPIVPDVDCVGQEGNGRVFATGPFKVVGPDVYGLDPDHDGVACEYNGPSVARLLAVGPDRPKPE